MNQPKRSPAAPIAAGVAAVLALSVGIVAKWEGERRTAYKDIVGVPTICFGHTADVKMGQTRTKAECEKLLQGDLRIAYSHVQRCITYPLKPEQAAAFTSLVINTGPKGVCGSTLQRHANRGEMAQACNQLHRWVYAGGKRVQGLANRRMDEYRLCMRPMVVR